MEYSIKERLEQASEVGKKSADVDAARELLKESETAQADARSKFIEILNRSKEEVTPELIFEAYDEYRRILIEDISKKVTQGDFDAVEQTARALKELASAYETDQKLLPESVQTEVNELFAKYKIAGDVIDHYLNRARLLAARGRAPGEILHDLEWEMQSPNPSIKARAPWSGWNKTRNAN